MEDEDFKTILQNALDEEGLELSEDYTLEACVEYILLVNETIPYLISDWIRDTKQNYPETFK